MSSPPDRPSAPTPDKQLPVGIEHIDRSISHPWYQYPVNVTYVLCKEWNGRIVRGYFDSIEKEWKNIHGDPINIKEWI